MVYSVLGIAGVVSSFLLFGATFSTRVIGTLIAVYGVFIPAIGWEYALWMWVYALVCFVFNDAVKVATYRIWRYSV